MTGGQSRARAAAPWGYLRSQRLHENERLSDIARLFLPGAAVILFLAAHLLQSGSRECCEEEGQRAEGCGEGWHGKQGWLRVPCTALTWIQAVQHH